MNETAKDHAAEQPGDTPSDSPPNVAETKKDGQREKSATPESIPASTNGNPIAGTSGANSPRGAHLVPGIET